MTDRRRDLRQDAGWHAEVELKLQASRDDLAHLLAAPPLAFAVNGDASPVPMEAVYYDTRERSLQKAGVVLRVRREGGRFRQTVKLQDAAGGPHARLEHTREVEGYAPRVALLHEATGERFADLGDADLEPLFATRVMRRTIVVPVRPGPAGGRIEVAIDQGLVEAGDRREDIGEIELELIEGDVADLYHLALVLHRIAPLAIDTRTKSDRGHTLAGAEPPAWRKAGSVELTPSSSLDDAITAVFGQCFGHWIDNQAAALDGRDIEGVHQMRVALRRLRAAFSFFSPWLPDAQASWLDQEARWLGRRLGSVRDLDVLLADTLAPVRLVRGRDRDLSRLADLVERRQVEARAELVEAIASPRYTTLVLTFGQWLADRTWRAGSRDGMAVDRLLAGAARQVLDRCHEAVIAAGTDFESLDREERHELRLEVKRLRYAVQFVGDGYGDAKPLLKLLGTLQDELGAANDAALAEELLARLCRGEPEKDRRRLAHATGLVGGWWLAHGGGREERLRALWSEFRRMAPVWRSERPSLSLVGGVNSSN